MRNLSKRFAKKYLIALFALLFGAVVLSVIIVFAVQHSSLDTVSLSVGKSILVALCAGVVPACSFNGFCTLFLRVSELTKRGQLALVALVVPITLLAIPVGAVMLVPNIITVVKAMKKDE